MIRKSLLLSFLVFSWPLWAQDADPWDAEVTLAEGEVRLWASERPEDGWLPVQAGLRLEPGDRIKTGEGSRAELSLAGDGIVELGPRTEFEIKSLSKGNTVFSVALGALFAKIKSLWGLGSALRVETPQAVAAVRGTEFAVEVESADGEAHFAVFDEGSLNVSPLGVKESSETVLEANQEISARHGEKLGKAYILKRLLVHKGKFLRFRKRLPELKKKFRFLPREERREIRSKIFKRVLDRKRRVEEKRRKLKEQGGRLRDGSGLPSKRERIRGDRKR